MKNQHLILAFVLAVGLQANSQAASVLTEFEFNEGAGSTTTHKAGTLVGNLATINPANIPVATDDSPSGKAGDRSVKFNGEGYLVVDDRSGPVLALNQGPLTIEAWIKNLAPRADDPFAQANIVNYAPAGGYNLGVYQGQLAFTFAGVADIGSGLVVPNDDDTWHHVAAVWESSRGVTFYLDGQSQFIEETRNIAPPGQNLFRMGAWGNGINQRHTGSLDRVRVHNALLAAADLDGDAANPKPPLASTVVAYNFNEAAPPFANAATTVRPAVSSEEFLGGNTTFSTDTPSGQNGDFALLFDGGDRVTIDDPNGLLQIESQDLTIQAWIKTDQTTRGDIVVYGPPRGYLMRLAPNRMLQFTALGIADVGTQAAVTNDGVWHHAAVVHVQGQEVRYYVDGSLKHIEPYTGGVGAAGTQVLTLGRFPNNDGPFNGLIDRVKIHRGALTQVELDSQRIPGQQEQPPAFAIEAAAVISWPTKPPGFTLQVTTSLNAPVQWSDFTNVLFRVVEGGSHRVFVPAGEKSKFFRLFKP
ncbi:MAG: LamG domain-containing protein [Verrucomicrobiota bacterium]